MYAEVMTIYVAFYFKNWGKLNIFLKVGVWVKKNWRYFFNKKNLYATVYVNISDFNMYTWI